MTGDPWQAPQPAAVALYHLIDEASFQAPSYSADATHAVLSAGWRPPPQRIEDLAQLLQLAAGTILRTTTGRVWIAGTTPHTGYALLGAEVIWQP